MNLLLNIIMSIFYSYSNNNDISVELYNKINEKLNEEIIDVDKSNNNNQLFNKISNYIDDCNIFVCDITPDYIFNSNDQKLWYPSETNNTIPISDLKYFISPNVMLELGYYFKINKNNNLILLCDINKTNKISDLIPSMLQGFFIHYYNSSDDEYYKSIIESINEINDNYNKEWLIFDYKLSENSEVSILGLLDIKPNEYIIRVDKKNKISDILFLNNYKKDYNRILNINKKILNIKNKSICLSYYKDIYDEIKHLELIINHQFY